MKFVCAGLESEDVRRRLQKFPVEFMGQLGERTSFGDETADAKLTLRAISEAAGEVSWVVVDHYHLGELWERTIRGAGHRVAAIDDFRHRRHHADLLVSDAPEPFDAKLNSVHEDGTRALTGPEYSLIGVDPQAYRLVHRDTLQRILVSYGATDTTGETLKALAALSALFRESPLRGQVHVDVVVGPYNNSIECIADRAAKETSVSLHIAPASLGSLMADADLVLTAAGNSMVEAVTLHRPCVVTVTADNQKLLVQRLARESLICCAGEFGCVSTQDLAGAIRDAVQSLPQLQQRLLNGNPFDGRGAERIGRAMVTHSRLPNDGLSGSQRENCA